MGKRSGIAGLGAIAGAIAATVLGASLTASPVAAADYLRGHYGPQAEPKSQGIDWAGFYGGAHAGITAARTGFTEMGRSVGRNVLPNLAISDQIPPLIALGETIKQGSSFGVFAGANYLWDDVVLGFEVDYTRSSITGRGQSGPVGRTLSAASTGTDAWRTTVGATARSELKDWWTLRARAGWAAGWFMPYVTAGAAFGNIQSTATGTGTTSQFQVTQDTVTGVDIYTLRGTSSSSPTVRHRGISYGGVIGAGVDVAFFSNFFVRAEWQYLQFASGGARPEVTINTGRVAGALKF